MLNTLVHRDPPQTTPATSRVLRGGQLALSALRASRGHVRCVPGFETTPFRLAGDTLVWIGASAPMHPRVLLIDAPSDSNHFAVDGAFCLPVKPVTVPGPDRLNFLKPLVGAILGEAGQFLPPGFATLLTGREPAFPLSHRAYALRDAVAAIADQDSEQFVLAASRLLGVGSGLTPSGDDVVGGMLFGLHWMQCAAGHAGQAREDGTAQEWHAARLAILDRAKLRTHAISAALLHDMAFGQTYDALHELATALFQTTPVASHANDAARAISRVGAVTAIGHSSGWDMLTGFLASLTGTIAFPPS